MMMKFLEHDIADKNFLRYVKQFLIAGIMEGNERKGSDKGTPQGGQISSIPANVYLYYVLDLWYEKICKGEVYYIRYADDFLMMFQYENEAWRVMEALKKRLEKFSLEVAEDKTRILPIGRFKGTKEDFDFPGFTFFNTQTREGKYRLRVRTSKKKMKAKKQAVKKWLHDNMHKPIGDTMKQIQRAMQGHFNYYGVSGNFKQICKFRKFVKYSCYKVLNKRHKKRSMKYPDYLRIWKFCVTEPHLTKDIWNRKPKPV